MKQYTKSRLFIIHVTCIFTLISACAQAQDVDENDFDSELKVFQSVQSERWSSPINWNESLEGGQYLVPNVLTYNQTTITTLNGKYLIRRDIRTGNFQQRDTLKLDYITEEVVGNDMLGYAVTYNCKEDPDLLPANPAACEIVYVRMLSEGIKHRLVGHKNTPLRMQMSSDGRRLLSTSLDGTIRLWALDTGKEIAKYEFENNLGRQFECGYCFSPDGLYAVIIVKGRVLYVKSENAEVVRRWGTAEQSFVNSNALPLFAHDGKSILIYGVFSDDNTVQIKQLFPADGKVVNHSDGSRKGSPKIIKLPQKNQYLTYYYDDNLIDGKVTGGTTIWDADLKPIIKEKRVVGLVNALENYADDYFTWNDKRFIDLPAPPNRIKLDDVQYSEYSPDGKYLITLQSKSQFGHPAIKVWDASQFPKHSPQRK